MQTYASAALYYVQNATGRAVTTQTWDLALDAFPIGSIELPYPPLQSVASITYLDADGDVQTWNSNSYTVDLTGGRIAPLYGTTYPTTRTTHNAVTVRFVAGYADDEIPEALTSAMLLIIGDLYENREAQQAEPLNTNRTVQLLLNPFRVC